MPKSRLIPDIIPPLVQQIPYHFFKLWRPYCGSLCPTILSIVEFLNKSTIPPCPPFLRTSSPSSDTISTVLGPRMNYNIAQTGWQLDFRSKELKFATCLSEAQPSGRHSACQQTRNRHSNHPQVRDQVSWVPYPKQTRLATAIRVKWAPLVRIVTVITHSFAHSPYRRFARKSAFTRPRRNLSARPKFPTPAIQRAKSVWNP